MSRRLTELERRLARVESDIETELRRLRQGCKHKEVIRTTGSGPYLFMCARCKSEEHGWYLHHMRFAHEGDIPIVSKEEFYQRRPPGRLFIVGRDQD